MSTKQFKAFTVLELLLVLAVMTVLISIVVYSLRPEDIFQTTNKLEIENDTKEIQTAYTTYKLNNDGNSPFGGNLISGVAYKICKEEITDCDINYFEVSLNPLKAARLLKNIPEIPDNEDIRYTGYVLSDINGASLSVSTQTDLVYTPENTPPGECFTYLSKTYCPAVGSGGKIWLDRNLGATNIPTNLSDANGFGTLYQFGRGTDGHEIRTSSLSVGPSGSITPGSNFLTTAVAPFNWYNGTNPDNLWQGSNGINNPCPPTWRIPSQNEWETEIASWSTQNAAGGFSSPLKLITGGRRDNTGSVQEAGTVGYYWSYTTNAGLDTVKVTKITGTTAEGNTDDQRVEGMTVRCIKDENATFIPSSPTANFILTEDTLGKCTGTININGTYKQGTALTPTETIELSVFVVSPGAYSINTDLINGYSFSSTGTFNSTGNTTAILTNNSGTPLTDGTDNFTATLLSSNCTFKIDVALALYGNFADKVDTATGDRPVSIAIGDLNGDGKADLAVANDYSNTVSTFMNNGDGTFANKVDKNTGFTPFSVAIGDLNGDSKADLVVANYDSSSVSTFMNNGDGTFADKVDKAAGYGPSSVAIGDLNGDGKADLAVATDGLNTVSTLMNNGDGTFADKVDKTGSFSYSLAIGDLNGDGKADLAVANWFHDTVSTFMNNGDGTFADKVDKTTGDYPTSVAIGDLNGDSKADLAVTNMDSDTVSIFMNNGDGTFANKVDNATGHYPLFVAIGDLNGDGKADLAVTNSLYTPTVSTFINNGDGSFANIVGKTTGDYPRFVAIGDLNGDGKADLAVANLLSNSVSVFINQPQL
ncbi:VCBS repeat-containing protein [Candidatus Dojkabacteria bacterium]|nr:VCBS repeat-containing protein [Candidatus Dojkabacteria bacterium]